MKQVTLRLGDGLADDVSRVAASRGESVNAFASAVLAAATDPDAAGDEAARLRERLARAGLLATAQPGGRERPDAERVARARRRAGSGRPLSEYVSEGRR